MVQGSSRKLGLSRLAAVVIIGYAISLIVEQQSLPAVMAWGASVADFMTGRQEVPTGVLLALAAAVGLYVLHTMRPSKR